MRSVVAWSLAVVALASCASPRPRCHSLCNHRGAQYALERVNEWITRRLGKSLISRTRRGQPRVGYGLVGYIRTGGADLYLVPKCLSVPDLDVWAAGVCRFLSICEGLTSRNVAASGAGAFSAGNVLLPWWADHYGRVLRRALDAVPFLRYEPCEDRMPYIRGQIRWSAQVRELAGGSSRVVCRFRRYQADHTLNRLLKWAATRLGHLRASVDTRRQLESCAETLALVPDVPPERSAVMRVRIPASHSIYVEPFEIAKQLYMSAFPTLARGGIPGTGFVIDMVRAFEGFVEGLIRRAVRRGRAAGHDWRFASQQQELLATSVGESGGSYYTRPDNVVWAIGADSGSRGVVIDAKYKGMAGVPRSYARPVGGDLYQVVVACVSRGWDRALIIAPTVGEAEPFESLVLQRYF